MTLSDSQRILDAVRRLVRLLRLYDRSAQNRLGLSAAQLFVLSELGKTPSLSLGELAERTHTDQSSVSVVVTRLVEAGLVERQRAQDDGRRLVLTLTRAGRNALQKAPPVAQEQLLEIIARLTPAERKRFAETFARIVDELGAGPAEMLFEESGATKDLNRNERTRPRARRNQ